MATMSPSGPATVDDLRKVPKDGRVYELVDGAIVVTPAGMRHSEVAVRITTTLANFVWPRGLGEIYSENVGIRLPTGNVRSPDGCFVRAEKLPGGRSPEDFGALVPDLAVEVLSPHDHIHDVLSKVHEYLACGVPLVWVVDPDRRTVTSYRSPNDVVEQSASETLTAEPVLPGFSCQVAAFFPR
jgi:Uma2 family endonuclease